MASSIVAFGRICAIDAAFQMATRVPDGYVTYLTGALDGQRAMVKAIHRSWRSSSLPAKRLSRPPLHSVCPANLADYGGILLSLVIWSTAEGLGGTYQAGSTDIGAAISYVLVFIALSYRSRIFTPARMRAIPIYRATA